MRSIGGVATAFAALAIAAPASHAAAPTYAPPLDSATEPESRTLTYNADQDQANRLSMSALLDGTLQLTDPAGVTGCEVSCALFGVSVSSITVGLGGGDDELTVGPGLPVTAVQAGEGLDRADLSQSSTAATISDVEDASGGSGADTITAGASDSTLYGQGGADTLTGGASDDTLAGGADDDTLTGGVGGDTLLGGDGPDKIIAVDGVADTISCGDGVDQVDADLGVNGVTDMIDESCETVTGVLEVEVAVPVTKPSTSGATVLPVPVLAPGIAAPRDLKAPAAYVRSASRQRLSTVLKRGLLVPVGCAESCGVSVNVLLDRKVARRLDLAGRSGPAVIGTGTARLTAAGARTLRVKLTQNARRALRSSKKSVRVTLQVLVSDAAGNAMLLQRRISMRG